MSSPTNPRFVPAMLGAPLRLAYQAPLEIMLYLGILSCTTWAISVQVGRLFVSTVQAADANLDFAVGTLQKLIQVAHLAGWVVGLPCLIIAAALPVRLGSRGTAPAIGLLLQLSPNGYLQAFRTIYIAIRVLIYQLIPLVALYFLYAFLGLHGATASFQTAATVIAVLVAIPLILRLIPILHGPLAAIVLDFPPGPAIQFSRQALLPFVPNLFICAILCGAGATGLTYAYSEFFESSAVILALIWVCATWIYLSAASICIAEVHRQIATKPHR